MVEIKNILYATDLSENSAYAFQYATDMAEKHDAVIHILHVLEKIPTNTKAMVDMYLSEEQKKAMAESSKDISKMIVERLNVFCDRFRADDPSCVFRVASVNAVEGFTADVILKKAHELQCDAIVMGTHGKGFIQHAFLGSVAEKVLRRATKPVFIIPLPHGDEQIALHDI